MKNDNTPITTQFTVKMALRWNEDGTWEITSTIEADNGLNESSNLIDGNDGKDPTVGDFKECLEELFDYLKESMEVRE